MVEGALAPVAAPARPVGRRENRGARVAARRLPPLPLVGGALLWVAAVAVGFRAQHAFFADRALLEGSLIYGAAAVLVVAGAALIDRRAPLPVPPVVRPDAPPWRWRSRRLWIGIALGLIAIAACGFATNLVYTEPESDVRSLFFDPRARQGIAFWVWTAALLLALAGSIVASPDRYRPRLPRPDRRFWTSLGLVLLVLIVALAFRLPSIETIPPQVHGDEAAIGLSARDFMSGRVPSFFAVGWAEVPSLSYLIPAAFMAVFGDNLLGLRLASVAQGVLSILLTYLIVRRLFGWRVGLIASLLLGVSHWHTHFSRTGFSYMQSLFFCTLVFYLMLRAIDSGRAADWLLTGLAIGAAFEVYYGARLVPVLVGTYLVYRAAFERGFLMRHLRGALLMGGAALLFVAPLAAFFVRRPAGLMSRTSGVMITSPEVQQHLMGALKVDSFAGIVLMQARNALLAFNVIGETSGQYGHPAPLVDYYTSVFLVLGMALVLTRFGRSRYFFVALWCWPTLIIGGVLTVDALFSPRVTLMIPTLFIAAALAVDTGWRAATRLAGRIGTGAFGVGAAALLVLAARDNYDAYFILHVKQIQPAGFSTVLSNYINSINDRYRVYWIGPNDSYLHYDTTDFLMPNMDAVDVREKPLPLPLDRLPRDKGVAFLVRAGTERRLADVERQYPVGRQRLITTTRQDPLFYSYLVEHDALVAVKPDARLDTERIPGIGPDELDKPRRAR